MATTVQFIFSRQILGPKGGVMQFHDEIKKVAVPGEVANLSSLNQAEALFLNWFKQEHPNQTLIQWKARYADGEGLYSEYRTYLPS